METNKQHVIPIKNKARVTQCSFLGVSCYLYITYIPKCNLLETVQVIECILQVPRVLWVLTEWSRVIN